MSPGESTLLKILAQPKSRDTALDQFHAAFPTDLARLAFERVLASLTRQRLITSDNGDLMLTAAGREALDAETRAEEMNWERQ